MIYLYYIEQIINCQEFTLGGITKILYENIVKKIESPQYDFLRSSPNLGGNTILLGIGGSHAYGTATETSDLDIRGIATNSARNILLGKDFEQVVNANREQEHDLLMAIRNGEYLDENRQPISEFYDLVNELEGRLNYDKDNTDLPEEVNMKRIEDFVFTVNRDAISKGTNK